MAVGHEFYFPINFSSGMHLELAPTPTNIASYANKLAESLSICREVLNLLVLVHEQHAWHQELVDSCHKDPRVYKVGGIVFARLHGALMRH